jgi:hypothetical protein
MSDVALKEQVHQYIDMLPIDQVVVINELLAILISNETVIETDITEEEHAIIEASRELYRTNPENFISLPD